MMQTVLKILFGISTSFWMGCQDNLELHREFTIHDLANDQEITDNWKELLETSVQNGSVDFAMIQEQQDILEKYLAWTSVTGTQMNRKSKDPPWEQKDKTAHRLTFYVNARNAWLLYAYLEQHQPQNLHDTDIVGGFFWGQRARVDGQWMRFTHIKEERLLADFQDARIHFMLHDLTLISPRLEYWEAKTWERDVEKSMQDFFTIDSTQPFHKAIQENDGRYLFHPMFQDHADDFVDWSESDSVCDFIRTWSNLEIQNYLEQNDCSLSFFREDGQVSLKN